MSTLIWQLDPTGKALSLGSLSTPDGLKEFSRYFPNCDKHRMSSSFHRQAATNIYKTKDNRYFHLHGESHRFSDFASS
jgi:hypothetical protein